MLHHVSRTNHNSGHYGAVTLNVATGLVTAPTLAAIRVVPGAVAVASPLVLRIATPAELLCQVNVTPLMVFPLASKALAVYCWVWPTLMVALIGETETDATGALVSVTVSATEALLRPVEVAVISVVPTLCPVATPLLSMLAMSGALLSHVNVSPVIARPLESAPAAVNGCWAPIAMELVLGVTVMALSAPGAEEPPQLGSSAAPASNKNNRVECALKWDLSSVA
jgi:hypothetical protein